MACSSKGGNGQMMSPATGETAGTTALPTAGSGSPAPSTGSSGTTPTAGTGAVTTGSGGAGGTHATAGTGTAGMVASAGTGTAGSQGASGTVSTAGAGGATAAAGSTGAAGSVASGAESPCITAGSQVVFIGDSYSSYLVAHTDLSVLVQMRAQMAGALPAGQNYINDAVAGTTLGVPGASIPPQWDAAKANLPIYLVVMDGGGNDVLIDNMQCLASGSQNDPGCQMVVTDSLNSAKMMWASMQASGVTDVIYFWYPHINNGDDISDYAYPMLQAAAQAASTDTFHVYMVGIVDLFNGHPEYIFLDGIHANDTGENVIADAVWKVMTDHCIGQGPSSGCCMMK